MESYELIILVIASPGPLYDFFKEIWNRYDKTNPRIKVFYTYGSSPEDIAHPSDSLGPEDSSVTATIKVEGSSLISKIPESLKPGVLIKTLDALDYIDKHYDYDMLLRTNLSTFLIFDRLSKYIKGLPNRMLYEGVKLRKKTNPYASGAGFFLSRDLVKLLVENRVEVEKEAETISDDRRIGAFLKSKNVKVRTSRHRYDICNHRDEKTIDQILETIKIKEHFYHIRFKCLFEEDRARVDRYGMLKALNLFYQK